MLSVALVQEFAPFRVLPGMLPYGVRTFLGHQFARVHPTDLEPYYTVNVLEVYRSWRMVNRGIRYQLLGD